MKYTFAEVWADTNYISLSTNAVSGLYEMLITTVKYLARYEIYTGCFAFKPSLGKEFFQFLPVRISM